MAKGKRPRTKKAKATSDAVGDPPYIEDAQDAVTGRPSAYQPSFAGQAEKLCRLGATDEDIAEFFGVSSRTIYRWKSRYQDFSAALKTGKEHSDERVERSLYHKAVGYTFDAVKIMQYEGAPVVVPFKEHVPPDTTAAIFWLKNRRPDLWRDVSRQEHTGKDGAPIPVNLSATDELISRIARLSARSGKSGSAG